MLHIMWMLLIGLVVGAIAKFMMPGRDPGGFAVTMLLGVAGAFVAGFIGRMLGLYGTDQSAGLIMSTLGAILLLGLYRLIIRHEDGHSSPV
jgi:uncharacterized membrane protein YeaQ/YmgE (transglycosylase-associated protein family)